MQTFICPECGHTSTYDPWAETARCSKCGHTPPSGIRMRGRRPKKQTGTHQSFLDELLSHWNGTHTPNSTFAPQTPELALAFFQDYQRALGEDPHLAAGGHMRYVRNYHPQRGEILAFVGAYLLLKRGNRATAAQHLGALTMMCPKFADPWVWLTATTDDLAERKDYLENALAQEPAHPLARDAMAVVRGKVTPTGRRQLRRLKPKITTTKCPQCAGALHYEPGAREVVCPYCSHQLNLREINLLEEEATPIGDLQLRRRYRGHTWAEVQRIVRCQSCGAELTMTHRLAKHCLFCGSTNVLLEDNRRTFEQPDGFLPFKVNQQQAAAAIHKTQHSGLRGLKTWLSGKEQQVRALQGVYLPFWVFDGFVEARSWIAHGPQLVPAGGTTPNAGMWMFDNLLFSGADVPPPPLVKRLFPFNLDAMVPYEPHLLADWPAKLYNLDVEMVAENAYDTMIAMARQRAGPLTAPEPSSEVIHLRRSFQVSNATYQLVLLPVWVALVQHKDKHSLVLVNGQTGKVAFGPRLSAK